MQTCERVEPSGHALPSPAIRPAKQVPQGIAGKLVLFPDVKLLDQREGRLMLSCQHGTALTFDAAALNAFAQFDQVVWRRHGDDQMTLTGQHARALGRVATAMDRSNDVDSAVQEGQPAIRVGDDPRHLRMPPHRVVRGRCGQVQPDGRHLSALPANRREQFTRSRTEINRDAPSRQQGSDAAGHHLDGGTANTLRQQARTRLDGCGAVASLKRTPVVRLEQVDVAAPGDVIRMPARTNQRSALTFEEQPAIADGTGKRKYQGDDIAL